MRQTCLSHSRLTRFWTENLDSTLLHRSTMKCLRRTRGPWRSWRGSRRRNTNTFKSRSHKKPDTAQKSQIWKRGRTILPAYWYSMVQCNTLSKQKSINSYLDFIADLSRTENDHILLQNLFLRPLFITYNFFSFTKSVFYPLLKPFFTKTKSFKFVSFTLS